ncbi:MAG: protein-L-isoaspartate O-methyltransferase [Sneathiellaceae bacterium]
MTDGFSVARRHMVDSQILPNKVSEGPLVDAMGAIPRERFVPKAYRGVAYLDEDLPIGNGRHLLEPVVLARLVAAAEVTDADLVLDIGAATGYSTAVLAALANTVVGLECDPDLAGKATELLADLGVDNAAIIEGPLENGLPDQGPFDIILLQGAVEAVPQGLLEQLAEHGRLLAVVLEDGVGKATRFLRVGDGFGRRVLFDAGVPLLPGFRREKAFQF